jgi:hypothetical protein
MFMTEGDLFSLGKNNGSWRLEFFFFFYISNEHFSTISLPSRVNEFMEIVEFLGDCLVLMVFQCDDADISLLFPLSELHLQRMLH